MVIHKKRKTVRDLATADDVALAACRALMRAGMIIDGDEWAKKAMVLARFAVAMKTPTGQAQPTVH